MLSVPIIIENEDKVIRGEADPISDSVWGGFAHEFIITLNGEYKGILSYEGGGWSMNRPLDDPDLVETLGNYLQEWYE